MKDSEGYKGARGGKESIDVEKNGTGWGGGLGRLW